MHAALEGCGHLCSLTLGIDRLTMPFQAQKIHPRLLVPCRSCMRHPCISCHARMGWGVAMHLWADLWRPLEGLWGPPKQLALGCKTQHLCGSTLLESQLTRRCECGHLSSTCASIGPASILHARRSCGESVTRGAWRIMLINPNYVLGGCCWSTGMWATIDWSTILIPVMLGLALCCAVIPPLDSVCPRCTVRQSCRRWS
jgi:hypothetical protein